MATVSIRDNELVISMQGLRKFGAFKSEFSVPLSNVKSAATDTEAWKNKPINPGNKEFGTNLYGVYFGGIFVEDGKRVFYDLGRTDKAVVIELKEAGDSYHIFTPHVTVPEYDDFSKLVIGVDSPDETVKLIEDALQRQE